MISDVKSLNKTFKINKKGWKRLKKVTQHIYSVIWCSIYSVVWSKIFGHMVFIYSVIRFWSNGRVSFYVIITIVTQMYSKSLSQPQLTLLWPNSKSCCAYKTFLMAKQKVPNLVWGWVMRKKNQTKIE